jgi:hypothetical protein
MKKSILFAAAAAAVFTVSCGARDDKNKVESYPTYDTTSRPHNLNDSTGENYNGSHDMRHNIDEKETKDR